MELYLFALLPLGLLSYFSRKDLRSGTAMGILPLLMALAPAAIAGVRSLMNRNSQNSQMSAAARQQQQQEMDRQKAEYYNANYSPQAQSNQAMATLQLGRLAGAMGGLANVPPALRNMLQQRRTPQQSEYNLGSSQKNVPHAPGGIGQDIMTGLASYNPSAYYQNR